MTKDTITLPASTLEKLSQLAQLLEQAGQLAREISQERRAPGDESQAWYWSEPWQVREREADDAWAKGDYLEFDSAEALITDLHAEA